MTWIKTAQGNDLSDELRDALELLDALYPPEYAPMGLDGVVGSHSLFPNVMRHAFATFGALMSPDMPLSRREQEMIAVVVSVENRCGY